MIFIEGRLLSQKTQQSGFTLITAIFLLVVVALLSSYIVTLRSVQQSTVIYGIQGVQAMQAARTGIEWGIYKAIPPGTPATNSECSALSREFKGSGAIEDFRINVTCIESPGHFEGSLEITAYRLTSTAETGTYGTLDYVSRRLQATISIKPP
jgi:MSHA biogenesis protein MshP